MAESSQEANTTNDTSQSTYTAVDYYKIAKSVSRDLYDILMCEKLPATDDSLNLSAHTEEIEEEIQNFNYILEILYDESDKHKNVQNTSSINFINVQKLQKITKNYESLKQNENLMKLLFHKYYPACGIAESLEIFHQLKTFESQQKKLILKDICETFESQVIPGIQQILRNFNSSEDKTWAGINKNIKLSIFDAFIDLQGYYVGLKEFFSKNGERQNKIQEKTMQLFSPQQIRDLIVKGFTNISKIEELTTDFYLDRTFITRNMDSYVIGNPQKEDERYHHKIKKRKQLIAENTKTFDDLQIKLKHHKILVIGDGSGSGKTTTLKHISRKLKDKYRKKWVCYIDAEKHSSYLHTLAQIELTKDTVKGQLIDLLKLTPLETEIFNYLYDMQRVIILWDHIDGIYQELLLNLIKNIYQHTSNQQIIITRNRYSRLIGKMFNTTAYKFIPFTTEQIETYYEKFVHGLDRFHFDYQLFVEFYCKHEYGGYDYTSPPQLFIKNDIRMFKMLFNYYKINAQNNWRILRRKYIMYNTLFEQNLEEFKANSQQGWIEPKEMTINEILQVHALKLMFDNSVIESLQIIVKFKNLNPQIPTIRGIYSTNYEDSSIEFLHEDFALFFVAEYLVKNIFRANSEEATKSEARNRLVILAMVAKEPKYQNIANQISNYLTYTNVSYINECDTLAFKMMKKAQIWNQLGLNMGLKEMQKIQNQGIVWRLGSTNKNEFWVTLLDTIKGVVFKKQQIAMKKTQQVKIIEKAEDKPEIKGTIKSKKADQGFAISQELDEYFDN